MIAFRKKIECDSPTLEAAIPAGIFEVEANTTHPTMPRGLIKRRRIFWRFRGQVISIA